MSEPLLLSNREITVIQIACATYIGTVKRHPNPDDPNEAAYVETMTAVLRKLRDW